MDKKESSEKPSGGADSVGPNFHPIPALENIDHSSSNAEELSHIVHRPTSRRTPEEPKAGCYSGLERSRSPERCQISIKKVRKYPYLRAMLFGTEVQRPVRESVIVWAAPQKPRAGCFSRLERSRRPDLCQISPGHIRKSNPLLWGIMFGNEGQTPVSQRGTPQEPQQRKKPDPVLSASVQNPPEVLRKERKQLIKNLKCYFCGAFLSTKDTLTQHVKNHLNMNALKCSVCFMRFSRKINLDRHALTHGPKLYLCHICGKRYHMMGYLKTHIINSHIRKRY